MSDTTENTELPEPEVPVTSEPQGEETTEQTDWKVEARKWEKRAKESNTFLEDAKKWREYEAAQKPEQERIAEELVKIKAEAEAAKTQLLRHEIATEKTLPSEALRLLTGSTREELEDSADTLLALIANQSKTKTLAPDTNQGQPANDKAGQLTTADLENMTAAEINAARKAGRLNDVLGIH